MNPTSLLFPLVGLAALTWTYWPMLTDTVARWIDDPQYSHGFVVPLFSLYLLWSNRKTLPEEGGGRWWGLVLLVASGALRYAGTMFYIPWFDALSILPALLGLVVVWRGAAMLRWAGPAILFLAFMIPLPYRIQNTMGGSLQSIATTCSTFVLQTLGVPAIQEGNIILLSEQRVGVVEACNGLSMMVTFVALSVAVCILFKPGWLESIIIVLSSFPIAVIANVIRIALTGMLYEMAQAEWAKQIFHDLAGWIMMPIAIVLLLVELYYISRVLVVKP